MIYVMSDIHGEYQKYKQMLEKIKFNEQDTLYMLGDVIDRGPDGIKILQDMMKYPNIVPLFGNHEYMSIKCISWLKQEITEDNIEKMDDSVLDEFSNWIFNGGISTIEGFRNLSADEQDNIIDYLAEFTLYEELYLNDKHYILVHAGLGNFDPNKSLEDYEVSELIWDRPDYDKKYFDDPNTYVIVGHTPTILINGKIEIYHGYQYIAIDCGATYEGGKLACLCLDTMEEFYVE